MPIDVATFLLNEKRAEVQTVETRFKVNVLLVPNRHLETPNYSVQRMRHDELNQGEPLPASFQMVEQPEDVDALAHREEAKEPRQEAVVKGITPSQPAPVRIQPTEQPADARHPHSWLSKMLHWFRTSPPATTLETPALAQSKLEPTRESRPPRSREGAREGRGRGDGRRDHGRRDDRHGERERREARGGDESRRAEPQGGAIESAQRTSPRKDAERRENRREPREGRGASAGRQPREAQRHEARAPMPDSKRPVASEPLDALEMASTNTPAATESTRPSGTNGAEDAREGGGRRRRGRRGRGGERTARPPATPGEGLTVVEEAVTTALTDAPAVQQAVAAEATAREPATMEPTALEPVTAEAPAHERIAAEAAAVQAPTASLQPAISEPVPASSDVVPVRERETAVIETIEPEPGRQEATSISAAADQIALAPASLTLPVDSDLVLVETRFAAAPAEDVEALPQRPRRVRPPRVTIADEPLQMVETHKQDSA
jgi:ribonuclease E